MRARERVALALRGRPTDRPALAYLFLGGARHVLERLGGRMGEAYRDAGRIAEAQAAAAELFGHDAGMVPWGCLTVEAEAFGCEVEWLDDYYPRISSHPLAETKDLDLLTDPESANTGRMPLVLESLALLRERTGDDLFIIAMVVSPFLVSAELRGMSSLLADFAMDPSFADALMTRVADGTERYVRSIAAQGAADAIMFENAGACREMMGPQHLERFVLPHERRLIAGARQENPDLFLIEHNCSKTPYAKETLSLDVDAVSMAHGDRAQAAARGIAWMGTVDSQRLLLEGEPEAVEREVRDQIRVNDGAPFVLSTSCEIPLKAPLANILALASAVRSGH